MKRLIISIEGDIGSGKSTLLRQLRELYPQLHFIDEPLETWLTIKNEKGQNILDVFYEDIEKNAYMFQNAAVLTRAQNIKRTVDNWKAECETNPELIQHNVFITERCLETDKHVFAQMLRDDEKLDGIEWDLYNRWYNMLESSATVDGLVYVDTSPEICLERIHRRGRDAEQSIPLQYLQNLDKYHHKWIDTINSVRIMKYNNSRSTETYNTPEDVMTFIDSLNHK